MGNLKKGKGGGKGKGSGKPKENRKEVKKVGSRPLRSQMALSGLCIVSGHRFLNFMIFITAV